jgi:hypothetical protein
MKQKMLKWYVIVGYLVQPETTENMSFIYFIESESPHNVLKNHGGRRKCAMREGVWGLVQFPTREKDVQLLPTQNPDLLPVNTNPNEVVKIIPVTRYKCACGEERYSEHPYTYMWCSCGQKAYRVPG